MQKNIVYKDMNTMQFPKFVRKNDNITNPDKKPFEDTYKTSNYTPTNDDILRELDAFHIETTELVNKDLHGVVFPVFKLLFVNDLFLRKTIAKQLIPDAFGDIKITYSEEELRQLVELQSYYNNFRIILLSTIANRLVELYDIATELVDKNVTLATQLFNATKQLDNWYISQIKEKLSPKVEDEQHIKMYEESISLLDEVRNTGLISMQKVLKANLIKLRTIGINKTVIPNH